MRYVQGPNLRDLARMGPLEPAEAFAITVQVAGALDAEHAHGLVHRDVKPSNVLVAPAAAADGSDHVYLADFGLSRKLGEQERRVADERLMGTVEYAAPEQIRGGDVDGRFDVYALSCLLYECLTGLPGPRHLEHILHVCRQHYNEHRSHRALRFLPSNGRHPTPLNAPDRLQRRDLLGGLIHEYKAG
jgi:serine/threonine protein kinase